MKIQDKKLSMADKMYKENSAGGKGTSPKYSMKGKNSKFDTSGMMNYTQNSKGSNRKDGAFNMANKKGNFVGKYDQADKSGSFQAKYNM